MIIKICLCKAQKILDKELHVYLAIRRGYVLFNSKNREYKNQYFRPNLV